MKIDGRFWLLEGDEPFLGRGRVELLERIDKTGSIHAAAKEMKMSYKAAWDRIDAMSRLAGVPLLERTVGGKGGGGTTLTDHAKAMIQHFRRLEELHRQFLDRFEAHIDNPDELARLLGRLFITTSARNQLSGIITHMDIGAMTTKIVLQLHGGEMITSTITAKAAHDLALGINAQAYAIIKSSDVTFDTTPPSAMQGLNTIKGVIDRLDQGTETTEVVLLINGGIKIVGIIDNQTANSQGFKIGLTCYALFSSSQVIIGI